MQKMLYLVLIATFTCSVWAQGPGSLNNGERPFSTEYAKKVAGNSYWEWRNTPIAIAGELFDDAPARITGNDCWVQFDIRGWDMCSMYVGMSDERKGQNGKVTFELDGDFYQEVTVAYGDKAQFIEIPLVDHKLLTIRWSGAPSYAKPRLIKGRMPNKPSDVRSDGKIGDPKQTNIPASFVTDPKDLEQLATALRKRVDGKPDLQAKLADGFVAVMTFNLIDIPSPSVGQNVAEDLSTTLINADFQLVERGQLDKALKELKIENSALIDQATAQQLGQITGCNYILVGSVSDRGQFIVINARILETATGKAVAAESVECRKIPIQR